MRLRWDSPASSMPRPCDADATAGGCAADGCGEGKHPALTRSAESDRAPFDVLKRIVADPLLGRMRHVPAADERGGVPVIALGLDGLELRMVLEHMVLPANPG